jgi:hypothetical protein
VEGPPIIPKLEPISRLQRRTSKAESRQSWDTAVVTALLPSGQEKSGTIAKGLGQPKVLIFLWETVLDR